MIGGTVSTADEGARKDDKKKEQGGSDRLLAACGGQPGRNPFGVLAENFTSPNSIVFLKWLGWMTSRTLAPPGQTPKRSRRKTRNRRKFPNTTPENVAEGVRR